MESPDCGILSAVLPFTGVMEYYQHYYPFCLSTSLYLYPNTQRASITYFNHNDRRAGGDIPVNTASKGCLALAAQFQSVWELEDLIVGRFLQHLTMIMIVIHMTTRSHYPEQSIFTECGV